jgi:hypothetical protein
LDVTPPPGHQLGVGVISLFVDLVLKAATSQRAAAAVLQIVACHIPGLERLPCANSGRLWLMRLGLYELTREKAKADDWVWMMDHTVQLGPWKCLVIVGVRLSAWNPERGPLKHEDLTLFNLTPMEPSTGQAVAEQLEATIQQTEIVPAAVLSDEGAELKTGMELLQEKRPEADNVPHLHDIKHKVATLLKQELHDDETWQSFVTKANRTKLQVTLTSLAFLVPPSLKNKARYMNLDTLVKWGRRALAFLDDPRDFPGQPIDRDKLEQKLGWLRDYREPLGRWAELLEVGEAAVAYVRAEGYHRHALEGLEETLTPLAQAPASLRLKTALLTFVAGQSRHLPEGQHVPGSSEVLESLLGKYKRIQGAHSKGGMTGALLNIGATLLEKTPAMIRKALATVQVHHVTQWLRDRLGLTIPAQQALAFRQNENVPQIQPLPPPNS